MNMNDDALNAQGASTDTQPAGDIIPPPVEPTLAVDQAIADPNAPVIASPTAAEVIAAATEAAPTAAIPTPAAAGPTADEVIAAAQTQSADSVQNDAVVADVEVVTDDAAPSPATDPEVLAQRVAALEVYVQKLEAANQEAIKGVLQQVAEMGNQVMQFQQNFGQMAQALGQVANKVNSMDPNRPVLEVTFCQYEPAVVPDTKMIVFKVTVHNDTHPEKPGLLEGLHLDSSDPTNVHWNPINISADLSAYIKEQLTEAGIPVEQWTWLRLREIQRERGSDISFTMGTDDSQAPQAANDDGDSAPTTDEAPSTTDDAAATPAAVEVIDTTSAAPAEVVAPDDATQA